MNSKITEIEELLGKGFDVEEITSDAGCVEVILTRGASTRVVTLDREDAADILWGPAFGIRRENPLLH
jgi:hypothetical protein